ncbi:ABC transporter permease [Methylobacterium indicum]|uniref:ABC transporter permease n=1 Tax=Methylobacterium indicum TaxID=1775910 RepID=A0ABR5HFG7_9HYPH|nr:ABC transporter permease [Methylobacterium indicum]KMO25328.1 ABC transporter permease [Methylobacterium indicum]
MQAPAAVDRGAALPAPAPRRALRAFLRNPTALSGLAILGVIAAAALAAPFAYPDDPLGMVAQPFLWPGQDPAYPLGTDSLGRDVAAGIAHGARISLLVGFAAAATGLAVGVLVGATAGYAGGRIDRALGRVIALFQTIPSFILLVVLVAIAQPSIPAITLAIGATSWPTVARLTRAEFRSLREKDFVTAARGLGYGPVRIVFAEILPNALPPIVVTASVMVASGILMESALSFMGLGDPNVVSWGSMIGSGREVLRSAWYLTAIPGVAIVLSVLALNLVGDGLNDALNPRLAGEA